MAKIFAADRHTANWKVCWASYFASDAFRRKESVGVDRGLYVLNYILQARQLRLPLDYRASITEIKHEAFSAMDQMIAYAKEQGHSIYLHEIHLNYARRALGEEEETESLHGQVVSFNEKDGNGFIRLDSGERAFFLRDDIMTLEAFTQDHAVGLSVHCRVIRGSDGLIAFDVRVP
jgi:cold shock CspA family protein